MAMAETVNNICSDDIETFWIAHKMFFLINQHSDELFTELGRLCFKTVSGASDEGKLFRFGHLFHSDVMNTRVSVRVRLISGTWRRSA